MSNAGVNANAEDVKRLAAALEHYVAQVLAAGQDFQSVMQRASWNDAQKQRFTGKYAEFNKRLASFVTNDSKPMIQYLHEYARRLDDIRGMRM